MKTFAALLHDLTHCLFKIDIQVNILARLSEHEVRTLIMRENIFGCPHEEGIDYPSGEECPRCPY